VKFFRRIAYYRRSIQFHRSKSLLSTRHLPFLLLFSLSALLYLFGFDENSVLAYQRDAILAGEWWRLLTAHLLHLNAEHLLLNLLALAFIWWIFFRQHPKISWSIYTLCVALGTGLGLLAFSPNIHWYVGLSGILHGLLVAALLLEFRHQPRLAVIAGFALLFKLGWEQAGGTTPLSGQLIRTPVVVDAHLFGALTALLTWLSAYTAGYRRLSGNND